MKKEPGDTNVSDALTKPLDEKRMTNLLTMMGYVFRGSAVTIWRLKSSTSLRRIASCFFFKTIKIVFSSTTWQQEFFGDAQ